MRDKNGQLLRRGDFIKFPDWANNYEFVMGRVWDEYIPDRAGCVVVRFPDGGTEMKRASELTIMDEAEVFLRKLES